MCVRPLVPFAPFWRYALQQKDEHGILLISFEKLRGSHLELRLSLRLVTLAEDEEEDGKTNQRICSCKGFYIKDRLKLPWGVKGF